VYRHVYARAVWINIYTQVLRTLHTLHPTMHHTAERNPHRESSATMGSAARTRGGNVKRVGGRQTGRSLHQLPNVATNRQKLLRIHMPDDVADDRRHDPLDTGHAEVR
jgi:hypothetical protein